MPVQKWQLYDPVLPETYLFEVNPNSGGTPAYQKNLTYQNTAGPGGKVLAFEGRDSPLSGEVSGIVLSEAQHEAFIAWFNKRRQVQLTDDLGRVFWIYITGYEAKREYKGTRTHPWRHPYTLKFFILDEG